MTDFIKVARGQDVRPGAPVVAAAGGHDLVLLRTAGGVKAFEGRCPHQGALLGEGELEGDTLVCRAHRWRFDVHTGARQGGAQCLTACPVVEKDDEILVDVSRLTRATAAPTRAIASLSGPRGWPLVGHIFSLKKHREHEVFERWAAEHGPLFVVRLPRPVVVLASPALCTQVLRERPQTFRRASPIERVFSELGAAGVFSAEGTAWRPQRKLAMEALAARHLRGFYPTLQTMSPRRTLSTSSFTVFSTKVPSP